MSNVNCATCPHCGAIFDLRLGGNDVVTLLREIRDELAALRVNREIHCQCSDCRSAVALRKFHERAEGGKEL